MPHWAYSHFLAARVVRGKLPQLIEQWMRICVIAERIAKRREAAAVGRSAALTRSVLMLTNDPGRLVPIATNTERSNGTE